MPSFVHVDDTDFPRSVKHVETFSTSQSVITFIFSLKHSTFGQSFISSSLQKMSVQRNISLPKETRVQRVGTAQLRERGNREWWGPGRTQRPLLVAVSVCGSVLPDRSLWFLKEVPRVGSYVKPADFFFK